MTPATSTSSIAIGRPRCVRCCVQRRRGFTFTEIMFAVILLGIGFIMLAGMFPVAIQQTRSSVEESAAAAAANSAASHLREVFTADSLCLSDKDARNVEITSSGWQPPRVWSVRDRMNDGSLSQDERNKLEDIWESIRGNMIYSQDPRYAWTAVYSRGGGENFPDAHAGAIVFVLESRRQPTFDHLDIQSGNLEPRLRNIRELKVGDPLTGVPDVITFDFSVNDKEKNCVAEGSFVVIAEGRSAGRIYRLGEQVPVNSASDPVRFRLVANYATTGATRTDRLPEEISGSTEVYVVGMSYIDPNDPDKGFSGRSMDIAAYSMLIGLK